MSACRLRAAVEVLAEGGVHPLAQDVRGHGGSRVGGAGPPGGLPRRVGVPHDRDVPTPLQGHGGMSHTTPPNSRNGSFTDAIDNAPWHRGKPVDEAMADNPHLEFYRLPSYSPNLNVIERFWKKLRRRATHNRLFDTIADRKASV